MHLRRKLWSTPTVGRRCCPRLLGAGRGSDPAEMPITRTSMTTSIRVALILAVLSIPSLARATDEGPVNAPQCGGGFVPARGPVLSSGLTADRAACASAPDHPAAPHVHTDGRWIGHDSEPGGPRSVPAPSVEHGRFPGRTGGGQVQVYVLRGQRERFDASGASFSVAPIDYEFCDNWIWHAESIAIYEDPVHNGWYLAYSVRLGTFVHVQYLGPALGTTVVAPKQSFLMRVASFWARVSFGH